MTTTHNSIASLIGAMILTGSCLAQGGPPVRSSRDGLRSLDPRARAMAFQSLGKAAVSDMGRSGALANLVERENAMILATQRAKAEVDEKYGEGYVEYYSSLLSACADYCNRSDPKVNRTLAEGLYDAESRFGVALARDHAREILPTILARSHSDVTIPRYTAVKMLGVISQHGQQLTPSNRIAIHGAVREAAMAPMDVLVRQAGVATLGIVGGPADLPLLRQVAQTDSARVLERGSLDYPVRNTAKAAIAKISAKQPR